MREFWQVDDNTIVFVADPSLGMYVIGCLLLCPILQTVCVVVSCNHHQLPLLEWLFSLLAFETIFLTTIFYVRSMGSEAWVPHGIWDLYVRSMGSEAWVHHRIWDFQWWLFWLVLQATFWTSMSEQVWTLAFPEVSGHDLLANMATCSIGKKR